MRLEPLKPRGRLEDYFSVIATLVSIGSIFLPWFSINITAGFSEYRSGVDLGNFTGTYAMGGLFALTISIFIALLHFFRVRWAFMGGIVNLFLGLGYLTGWLSFTNQLLGDPSKMGQIAYKMEPQYGLQLFIFASIFQTISLTQSQRAYRESLQKENPF